MPCQVRFDKAFYFLIIHIFEIIPTFIKIFICFKQSNLYFYYYLSLLELIRTDFITVFPITNNFHKFYLYSKIYTMNIYFEEIKKLENKFNIEILKLLIIPINTKDIKISLLINFIYIEN